MKLVNKLLYNIISFTLCYKIYDTCRNLIYYIKDYNTISDTFYSDEFKALLKKYLNININKDLIGRLYGVINPNIDIRGNFNINNTIIEIDGNNTNSDEYVKNWAYKQLSLIGQLFRMQNLYDYIHLDFRHVGPIQLDNYLIIFDMVARQDFARSLKRTMIQLAIYVLIGIGIFLLI